MKDDEDLARRLCGLGGGEEEASELEEDREGEGEGEGERFLPRLTTEPFSFCGFFGAAGGSALCTLPSTDVLLYLLIGSCAGCVL